MNSYISISLNGILSAYALFDPLSTTSIIWFWVNIFALYILVPILIMGAVFDIIENNKGHLYKQLLISESKNQKTYLYCSWVLVFSLTICSVMVKDFHWFFLFLTNLFYITCLLGASFQNPDNFSLKVEP